jgi:hypothetical protein
MQISTKYSSFFLSATLSLVGRLSRHFVMREIKMGALLIPYTSVTSPAPSSKTPLIAKRLSMSSNVYDQQSCALKVGGVGVGRRVQRSVSQPLTVIASATQSVTAILELDEVHILTPERIAVRDPGVEDDSLPVPGRSLATTSLHPDHVVDRVLSRAAFAGFRGGWSRADTWENRGDGKE